jgi:hypothetical protein
MKRMLENPLAQECRNPFALLRGFYQVIIAEFLASHMYFLRDLNIIEWRLAQFSTPMGTLETAEQYEEVLGMLFFMRRRLNTCQSRIEKQRPSCVSRGVARWHTASDDNKRILLETSQALIDDLNQVSALIAWDFQRVQQNINFITSLSSIQHSKAAIKETQRTADQNKMLQLLAAIATFFIPISTISSVLNMSGDWAPKGAMFGQFWAICLPISALLVLLLVVLKYGKTDWIRRYLNSCREGSIFISLAHRESHDAESFHVQMLREPEPCLDKQNADVNVQAFAV